MAPVRCGCHRKGAGAREKTFPKINTIRLWLSYDAFRYEEDRQADQFETALQTCAKYGLRVIPCLFNCWHDGTMDNGGIYHPMMIEGSIWCARKKRFDSYFEKIIGHHKDDERILAWDICNEPYSYGNNSRYREFMEPYETAWLKEMCDMCRQVGVSQPLGISPIPPGTWKGFTIQTGDDAPEKFRKKMCRPNGYKKEIRRGGETVLPGIMEYLRLYGKDFLPYVCPDLYLAGTPGFHLPFLPFAGIDAEGRAEYRPGRFPAGRDAVSAAQRAGAGFTGGRSGRSAKVSCHP